MHWSIHLIWDPERVIVSYLPACASLAPLDLVSKFVTAATPASLIEITGRWPAQPLSRSLVSLADRV